jgi:hypothetical protein
MPVEPGATPEEDRVYSHLVIVISASEPELVESMLAERIGMLRSAQSTLGRLSPGPTGPGEGRPTPALGRLPASANSRRAGSAGYAVAEVGYSVALDDGEWAF